VKQFWVVGGEYTDTSFKRIVGGGEEERHGPFETYEAAEAEWSRLAWKTVDNCHFRYRVVEAAAAGAEALLKYWVVGGRYADTSFRTIAGGGREDWLGPFESYDQAEAEWSQLSWQTVDDCHARYRIVKAKSPPAP
jgi:hypothetical protein